jgi:hypothetical protein
MHAIGEYHRNLAAEAIARKARLWDAPPRRAPNPVLPQEALRKPDPLLVVLAPPPPPPEVRRPRFIRNGWMFRARGIIEHVAAAHGLEYVDLVSDRRFAKLVRPRQLAMHLCHEMLTLSLPEIGRRFGGKDHTTVLHAVRCIRKRLALDPDFAAQVTLLRAEIGVHMSALGIANDNGEGEQP